MMVKTNIWVKTFQDLKTKGVLTPLTAEEKALRHLRLSR